MDNKQFYEDPIYKDIGKSLKDLELQLRADDGDSDKGKFRHPFLSGIFRRFKVAAVLHPTFLLP